MIHAQTPNGRRQFRELLLVSCLMPVLPLSANAQEVAGRVISTVGDVIALRQEDSERQLSRGDEVYVGDQLITAENGRAQIRFVDDGLVDIRPDSAFEVVEYQEAEDGESGSAAMEFTAGALRTITGRIGNRPGDDYDMSTDIASIGIRGTDYSLQLCDLNCAENNQPEGLYGRVDDGTVAVTNQAGTTEFSQNQYFLVESEDLMPQLLPSAPQNVLDGSEDGETAEETTDDDSAEEEAAPIELAETDDNGEDTISTEAGIPLGTEFVAADNNPNPVPTVNGVLAGIGLGFADLDSSTDGIEFFGGLIRQGEGLRGGFTTNEEGRITSADFVDGWSVTSTDDATVDLHDWESNSSGATVYWGAWLGINADDFNDTDGFTDTTDGMTATDGITTTQPNGESFNTPFFFFIHSDDVTTPTQLGELTGTIDYTGYNDALVLSEGGGWDLQTMDMTIDFNDTTVSDFNLKMNDGSSTVTSNMSDISIDTLLLLDFDLEGEWVAIDESESNGPIDGNFNGQLIGEAAEGLIFSFDVDRLSESDREVLESILGIGFMVDAED